MSSITQYRKMLFALFVSLFVVLSPGAFAQSAPTDAEEDDNVEEGDGGDGTGAGDDSSGDLFPLGGPGGLDFSAPTSITIDSDGGTGGAALQVTEAGSTIVNDALLDFSVGGVQQDTIDVETDQDARAVFVVDRAVDVNVTRRSSLLSYSSGPPNGLTYAQFTVTNETNDSASGVILGTDFVDGFDIDNLAAQADPYNAVDLAADSDAFTIAGICWSTSIVITDCGTTGGGTSGTPAAPGTGVEGITGTGPYNTTDMDEFAPGTDVYVVVAVNVAGDLELSDFTNVALTAGVLDDTNANGGSQITGDTNGNDAPGFSGSSTDDADDAELVQNVFADANFEASDAGAAAVEQPGYNFSTSALGGDNDVDSDGQHTAYSVAIVSTALMSVEKTSEVIWDPINGWKYDLQNNSSLNANFAAGCSVTGAPSAANPKAIPGAIVMYTIDIYNDKDSDSGIEAAATDITISDTFPSGLTPGVDGVDITGTNGGSCSSNSGLDFAYRIRCDATVAADYATNDISGGGVTELPNGGGDVGDMSECGADESGSIVYFMTVD